MARWSGNVLFLFKNFQLVHDTAVVHAPLTLCFPLGGFDM